MITGASVQEIYCHTSDPALGSLSSGGCSIKGEAVIVDLKTKGKMFMIFARRNTNYFAGYYASAINPPIETIANYKWDVPRKTMPVLVTFSNLNDPKSVKEIDPDDLAATFGKGVNLVSVTAQYVDEPITNGPLVKVLPWLNTLRDRNLEGDMSTSGKNLSGQLTDENFKW